MRLKNVLISIPVRPEHEAQIRRALPEAQVRFARFSELSDAELASFDAVFGLPGKSVLPKLAGLRMLQLPMSGVADYLLKLHDLRPGAVLCSSTGAFGESISEYLLGYLLMLTKRLHEYRDDQREGLWENRGEIRSIRGMTVLIVGAGNIGTDFARLMTLMGSRTIGVRRGKGPDKPEFDRMHTLDELDSLLPQADVVVLALPETPQTVGLMGEKRIGLMKTGSYLLNVGRGSALDQDTLLHALQSGRLAGAAIDVTVPEPLPLEHPLWKEKNLILTPHISGNFNLPTTLDKSVAIACHNLAAWPEGPYRSRVDFDSGYRAQ